MKNTAELYRAAHNQISCPMNDAAINEIRTLYKNRVPFYTRISVSAHESEAASRLSQIASTSFQTRKEYRCFFNSSVGESISAAIKLSRMLPDVWGSGRGRMAVCWDPNASLRRLLDPTESCDGEALIPGVVFERSAEQVRIRLDNQQTGSLCMASDSLEQIGAVCDLLSTCQQSKVCSIFDLSAIDPATGWKYLSHFAAPDLICFGSNLTRHRAPAGCILMSHAAYDPWDRFSTYNLHSNTWGGNSASMALILHSLPPNTSPVHEVRISTKRRDVAVALCGGEHAYSETEQTFARCVNRRMLSMMRLGGMSKPIVGAHQVYLVDENNKQVIDASGTFGMNLRGHNATDVRDPVFGQHDPNKNHAADLEQYLHARSGFAKFFQATSGATANDTALSLALLAQRPRKRVIALTSGFHGKTLLALAVTHKAKIRVPFDPLYPHVTFLDIFSESFCGEFESLVRAGDVATVILETIQGEGGVRPCPLHCLNFIAEQRDKFEFLIIVDEVQSGIHRTGSFLHSLSLGFVPDLLTIGKGLSGM